MAGAGELPAVEHASRWVEIGSLGALAVRTDVGVDLICDASHTAELTRALLEVSPRLVRTALDDERRDEAKVALVRRTLTGYDAGRVSAVAAEFADDVLARHLRPDVVERVAWHRNQGHELVIVSASFTSYLDPIAARLGFAAVLATELAVGDDGRLTGELVRPNVRGAEKVRRLDEWLGAGPAFVWAYGDSSGDRDLLARADQGVMVGGRRGRG